MINNVLVVGASGAIGQALVDKLANEGKLVYAVNRDGHRALNWPGSVNVFAMSQHDETTLEQFKAEMATSNISFSQVFITVGVLHDTQRSLFPEKRLEDISASALSEYFKVNSVIPMLWLKHIASLITNDATVVCLSARVGSISDNKLGGWYGYRASKAALNMYIKTAAVEYRRRKKGVVFVSYHPGTVDSALSEPFQKNVPTKKLLSPEFTVQKLLSHIKGLNRDKAVHFIDWQGIDIEW